MNRKMIFLFASISVIFFSSIIFWPAISEWLKLFSDPAALIDSLRRAGAAGWVVLIILLVLQVFLAFIPGQALMIASGYVYGFWGGTALTWLGLVLGGQIAFWLARWLGRPFACRFVSPDVLQRWQRTSTRQGIIFYAFSLVLPVFPNDAMCYVAGLGEISPRKFFIANIWGRMMATLLTSFLGAYGAQIPVWVWVTFVAILVFAALAWIVRSFFKMEVFNVCAR